MLNNQLVCAEFSVGSIFCGLAWHLNHGNKLLIYEIIINMSPLEKKTETTVLTSNCLNIPLTYSVLMLVFGYVWDDDSEIEVKKTSEAKVHPQ